MSARSRSTFGNLIDRTGRLRERLVDALLPCQCLHCALIEPGSMPFGLCRACRGELAPIPPRDGRACASCAELLYGAGRNQARCLVCLNRRSPLERLFCLWSYQAPLDAVIQGLKFHDLPYLGDHLGRELARRLPGKLTVDAVVPVPLHWRRRWMRGYDQARVISEALALERQWPLERLLVRRRGTRPQSALARAERRTNLLQAFRPRKSPALRRARLLLVDDVYTTGATLEAAAEALRKAGAGWVGAAVIGRTPNPKH